jgi:SAM-dependent methyltransferase
VDGGCGTGSMAIALSKRGYQVAAFDLSFEMVKKAHGKGLEKIWQGDLRHVALSKGWDAFVCLFDTIQYLSLEEIQQCLHQVNQILRDDGLFLFDAVTERHVLDYWVDYYEYDQGDDWKAMRRSWYDRKERNQHTEFEINFFRKNKIVREHHLQKIYRMNEFDAVIRTSGFTCVGLFHGFTENAGGEDSDRVHFLLRKELI